MGFLWGSNGNNSSNDRDRKTASHETADHSEGADPTEQSPDYSEVDDSENYDYFSDDDDDNSCADEDEWEHRAVRNLMWQDSNHGTVLTQIYGSVWPRVLPYCLVNVILTYVIYYLKDYKDIDLTVSPSGHKYMAPLMSFLLVTRLKITFDNYMSNAKNLRGLYKACRDIVANLCLLTSNDTSRRAKQWRQDVTYSVLVLLRVGVGVLEFRSSKANPWLLPEMTKENSEELLKYSFRDFEEEVQTNGGKGNTSPLRPNPSPTNSDFELATIPSLKQRLAHVDASERNAMEEASRAVYVLAWNVRREILKQRDSTWFQSRELVWQHPCNEETRLLDYVGQFLKSFSGLYKLITTPIPLPMVQMCKVFLFVWLFTLPLTLCHKRMNHIVDPPLVTMLVVFIMTFGFLGLEFVSMELTDPFGNDPSDFDAKGHAHMVMEDAYIAINRVDGRFWAKALRKRIKTNKRDGTPQVSPVNSFGATPVPFPDQLRRAVTG